MCHYAAASVNPLEVGHFALGVGLSAGQPCLKSYGALVSFGFAARCEAAKPNLKWAMTLRQISPGTKRGSLWREVPNPS